MTTTKRECLRALQEAAERLGQSPTKAEYEALSITPSAATILRVVGGWNDAKELAGLETNPTTGSRTAPEPQDVDLPEGATWESLSQDQRWHYRNVERNTRRTLQRRQRHRRWLVGRKRQSDGCRDCPVTDPVSLDFHHTDPGTKTMAVNEMVLYGYSKERIREELDECILLCANCHRLRHRESPTQESTSEALFLAVVTPPETQRTIRGWTQAMRQAAGCRDCATRDPRCLLFHHVDPGTKRAGIAAMVSTGRSIEDIRKEMEQCIVLCANCHRRRHAEERYGVTQSDSV